MSENKKNIDTFPEGNQRLRLIQKESDKDPDVKDRVYPVNYSDLIKNTTGNRHRMAYNNTIRESMPDLIHNEAIIISSLLSPNNLDTASLSYGVKNLPLPLNVANRLSEYIGNSIDEHYTLNDSLEEYVKSAMFDDGAYAMVIIPTKDIGELQEYAIATAGTEKNIEVKLPTTKDLFNSDRRLDKKETNDYGLEVKKNDRGDEVDKQTRKNIIEAIRKNNGISTFDIGGGDDKYTDGTYALTKRIPIDAVTVIHRPGSPAEHVGYIVLLDPATGNPINLNEIDDKKLKSLSTDIGFKEALSGGLKDITTTGSNKVNNLEGIYNLIVDKEIKTALEATKLQNIVNYEVTQETKDVILTRQLKALRTSMLFIPVKNMAYLSFDLRENGTGKSVLERIRLLASMRLTLMLTRLAVNMKNSISTTSVDVIIPEDDPDPDTTMAEIMESVMSNRKSMLAFGLMDPNQIAKHIHDSGFSFKFKGGGLPEYDITIDENTKDIKEPEGIMEEDIKRQINLSYGLPAKIAEEGERDTLATAIRENKELMGKFINSKQKHINKFLSKFVKSVITNSPNMLKEVENILKEELPSIKKSWGLDKSVSDEILISIVVDSYIKKIEVSLPKLEISSDDGTLKAFEDRLSFVTGAVKMYYSEEALPEEIVGELGGRLEEVQEAIISVLMRQWMSENDFLPELAQVFQTDESGKKSIGVLDSLHQYQKDMVEGGADVFKEMFKIRDKSNPKFDGEVKEEPVSPTEDDEE